MTEKIDLVVKTRVNELSAKNTVEKSRGLMEFQRPFSLGELKVLDTYLSRINARDPSCREVRFSKNEYEKLLDIKQMRASQIEKYTSMLNNGQMLFITEDSPNTWRKINLFEECSCHQDEYEQWWITLKCTEAAIPYFFELEKAGYLKYRLANILNLKSIYSYTLYQYLLANSFRVKFEVRVSDLREEIGCDTERYKQFKFFNSEVLKKAVDEVNEKTDISVEYEPVKYGRTVVKIKFTVTTKTKGVLAPCAVPSEAEKALPDPIDVEYYDIEENGEPRENPLELFIENLPSSFTHPQIDNLRKAARDRLYGQEGVTLYTAYDIAILRYLEWKVSNIEAAYSDKKETIGSLYALVLASIRNGYDEPPGFNYGQFCI